MIALCALCALWLIVFIHVKTAVVAQRGHALLRLPPSFVRLSSSLLIFPGLDDPTINRAD
jgi:hypothetical protein